MFLFTCLFLLLLIFLTGACVGSFLTVAASRSEKGISFVKGRSHCDSCHQALTILDLVPIFSFLFLKGKCRYCKEKIPVRCLVIELVSGFCWMLCFLRFGFSPLTICSQLIASLFLLISIIDKDTMTISNYHILLLFAVIIIFWFFNNEKNLLLSMIGFFLLSLPMLLLCLLLPACFGGGDIKLAAVCGFLLGTQNTILGGFLAVLFCGIFSAFLIYQNKKKIEKQKWISFAPFLSAGFFLALLYGDQIISLYLSLFALETS